MCFAAGESVLIDMLTLFNNSLSSIEKGEQVNIPALGFLSWRQSEVRLHLGKFLAGSSFLFNWCILCGMRSARDAQQYQEDTIHLGCAGALFRDRETSYFCKKLNRTRSKR